MKCCIVILTAIKRNKDERNVYENNQIEYDGGTIPSSGISKMIVLRSSDHICSKVVGIYKYRSER